MRRFYPINKKIYRFFREKVYPLPYYALQLEVEYGQRPLQSFVHLFLRKMIYIFAQDDFFTCVRWLIRGSVLGYAGKGRNIGLTFIKFIYMLVTWGTSSFYLY